MHWGIWLEARRRQPNKRPGTVGHHKYSIPLRLYRKDMVPRIHYAFHIDFKCLSKEPNQYDQYWVCDIAPLMRSVPPKIWRNNNNVVITAKRRHFYVITSKLRRFRVITASLCRNGSAGVSADSGTAILIHEMPGCQVCATHLKIHCMPWYYDVSPSNDR